MSVTKYLKGECLKCHGPLEYPAGAIGTETQCPHCGQTTELQLLAPVAEPVVPRRVIVWTAVAIFILVAGLLGTLVALKHAQKYLEHQRATTEQK